MFSYLKLKPNERVVYEDVHIVFKSVVYSQRTQCPLIEEYSLNHNMNAPII